jgi:hypothetical protein
MIGGAFNSLIPQANLHAWLNFALKIRVWDPGSGFFLTPGSGIGNRFFLDPGIQTHIFESLNDPFFGKQFYNSLKIDQNFSLCISPLSFVAVFGSGIRDG